jgi:hypothetical protein
MLAPVEFLGLIPFESDIFHSAMAGISNPVDIFVAFR